MRKVVSFLLLILSIFFVSCDDLFEEEESEVSGINFENLKVEVKAGESKTVYLKVDGKIKDGSVRYSLSNDGIITLSNMSNKGCVITGVNSGSVILICEYKGYTSYLEVNCIDEGEIADPYIVLPFVSISIKPGVKKNIIASLYGGKEKDNLDFTFKSNSSSLVLNSSSNNCVIEGLKAGYYMVTVHHPKSAYDSYFYVYVEDNSTESFYLTTKSNVYNGYTGSLGKIEVSIAGGYDSDKSLITYEVTEGKDVVEVSHIYGSFTFKGLKEGKAVVKVSHPKADVSLYINVIIHEELKGNYITSDKDIYVMDGKEELYFNVHLNGTSEKGSWSVENDNSDVLETDITEDGIVKIKSKKDGKAMVKVKNSLSVSEKEILVIVEGSLKKSTDIYIKASSSYVKIVKGETEKITLSVINGNEGDEEKFSVKTKDSSIVSIAENDGSRSAEITEETSYSKDIYIKALSLGNTELVITNTVSSVSLTINVSVVSDLKKDKEALSGNRFVTVKKGEEFSYYFKSFISFTDKTITVKEKDILSFDTSSGKLVLKGLKEGVTSVSVKDKSGNEFIFYCQVTGDEEISTPLFYFERNLIEVNVGNVIYEEIKKEGEVNGSFTISVTDPELQEVYIEENILIIKPLKKGQGFITVKNDETYNKSETITLNVVDAFEGGSDLYFEGAKIIEGVKGDSFIYNFNLKNASSSSSKLTVFHVDDEEVLSFKGNGDSVKLNFLKSGRTVLTVKNKLSINELKVYIHIYETREEYESRNTVFETDKTNYLMNIGEIVNLGLYVSDGDIYSLSFEVSDTDIIRFFENNGIFSVEALSDGNASLIVYKGESFIEFNFSVKSETSYNTDKPSIIVNQNLEIITGDQVIVEAQCRNFKIGEIENLEWVTDSDLVELSSSGKTLYVKALSKGFGKIVLRSPDFGLSKDIYFCICDSVEEFSESPYFYLEKNIYSIYEGEELNLSLKWGTFELSSYDKDSIVFSSPENNCEFTYSKDTVYIKGLKEGVNHFTVTSDKTINSFTFDVYVRSRTSSEYYVIGSSIIKAKINEVCEYYFSIIDRFSDEITDYDGIKYSSDSSLTVNGNLNYVRFKAPDKKGSYNFTIIDQKHDVTKTVLVYVSENENDDAFVFTSSKDHFLLEEGEEKEVSLVFSSFDEEKIKSLSYTVSEPSVISLSHDASGSLKVKALTEGISEIKISYADFSYVLYFTVSPLVSFIDDSKLICESFIIMKENEEVLSYVTSTQSFMLSSYNENLIECEIQDEQSFKVKSLGSGETDIKVKSGNIEKYIKVIIQEEGEEEKKGYINVQSRYYVMNVGDSISIKPQITGSRVSITDTVYNFQNDNKVVQFTNNLGLLSVKAVNEGITYIDVTNKDCEKITLTFYVKNDESLKVVSNDSWYLESDKLSYVTEKGRYDVVLSCSVDGTKPFTKQNTLAWKIESGEEYIDIVGSLNSCNVIAKEDGIAYVSVSSPLVKNKVLYVIKVGKIYEKVDSGISYIDIKGSEKDIIYGSSGNIVTLSLVNCACSVNELEITDSKNDVISIAKNYIENILYLTLLPKKIGEGKITVKSGKDKLSQSFEYHVIEGDNGLAKYISTNSLVLSLRKNEISSCDIILSENFTEDAYDELSYEYDKSVIKVFPSHKYINVMALNKGNTMIKVKHPLSQNDLEIAVNVSEEVSTVKYITSDLDSNVIETEVSDTMSFFTVNLENSDETSFSKFSAKSSDETYVKVLQNNNRIYYKGVSKGQAYIIVTNTDATEEEAFKVLVVVNEEADRTVYFTSEKITYKLYPSTETVRVKAELHGVENVSSNDFKWSIYSQYSSFNTPGDIIGISTSGPEAIVQGLNEGIAVLKVRYKNLCSYSFNFYVTKEGTFSFSENSITLSEDEVRFVSITMPSYSSQTKGSIDFRLENTDYVSVIGNTDIVCLEGLKEGETRLYAKNSLDGEEASLKINVVKKAEKVNQLNLSGNIFIMNSRYPKKKLTVSLTGPGAKDSLLDKVTWTVNQEQNDCISVYPDCGRESTVTFDTSKVSNKKYNDCIITVECEDLKIKKEIKVICENLNPAFAFKDVDTEIYVDKGETSQIEAVIQGGLDSEYDSLVWNVETNSNIVKQVNTNGRICYFIGIKTGDFELSCSKDGQKKTVIVHIIDGEYFTFSSNYINAYPGETLVLNYDISPLEYEIEWIYDVSSRWNVDVNTDEKKVYIICNEEGTYSLTGLCKMLGSNRCTINCKYKPSLTLLTPKTKLFNLTMEDGKDNDGKIEYLLYPPTSYVKYYFERNNEEIELSDSVKIVQKENHSSEYSSDPDAGKGVLEIKALREVEECKLHLELYRDKNFEIPTGKEVVLTYRQQYKDMGLDVYFMRDDGFNTMRTNVYDNVNGLPLYRLAGYDSSKSGGYDCVFTENNRMRWGESEQHYIVVKPKHEGQNIKSISMTVNGQTIYDKDDSITDENFQPIKLTRAKNLTWTEENKVFKGIVNTGRNADIGYDGYIKDGKFSIDGFRYKNLMLREIMIQNAYGNTEFVETAFFENFLGHFDSTGRLTFKNAFSNFYIGCYDGMAYGVTSGDYNYRYKTIKYDMTYYTSDYIQNRDTVVNFKIKNKEFTLFKFHFDKYCDVALNIKDLYSNDGRPNKTFVRSWGPSGSSMTNYPEVYAIKVFKWQSPEKITQSSNGFFDKLSEVTFPEYEDQWKYFTVRLVKEKYNANQIHMAKGNILPLDEDSQYNLKFRNALNSICVNEKLDYFLGSYNNINNGVFHKFYLDYKYFENDKYEVLSSKFGEWKPKNGSYSFVNSEKLNFINNGGYFANNAQFEFPIDNFYKNGFVYSAPDLPDTLSDAVDRKCEIIITFTLNDGEDRQIKIPCEIFKNQGYRNHYKEQLGFDNKTNKHNVVAIPENKDRLYFKKEFGDSYWKNMDSYKLYPIIYPVM